MVDNDFVTDSDSGYLVADRPDDPRGVGPADVILADVAAFLTHLDHIDRHTLGGPDIVEVHPGGHDRDENVVGAGNRDTDLLDNERVTRVTHPFGSDDLCEHGVRNVSQIR